eukprot:997006_1
MVPAILEAIFFFARRVLESAFFGLDFDSEGDSDMLPRQWTIDCSLESTQKDTTWERQTVNISCTRKLFVHISDLTFLPKEEEYHSFVKRDGGFTRRLRRGWMMII